MAEAFWFVSGSLPKRSYKIEMPVDTLGIRVVFGFVPSL